MFEDVYLWIKALHVIAVIAWMAGMLYLPRLFVYHCEAEIGSKQSETFKIMERRLLKAIINPAMIVTWLAGLYLAWSGHWFSFGWLHVKLALVFQRPDTASGLKPHRRSPCQTCGPYLHLLASAFQSLLAPPSFQVTPQDHPNAGN